MSTPKGYVGSEYLHLLEEQMMDYKRRSYARMNIQPGDSVLDVGCGPGSDTIHLAQLVGAAGQVVGVDYDEDMVAQANQRAHAAGLAEWVKHQQGNATSLPFPDAQFHACRSERLFQHLLFPEQALFEMARVTKPGGWVVVLDTDWGTLSIHTSLPEIERRLVQFSNEGCMHNSYSGRRLPQLFAAQGLRNISVEVLPFPITNYALCREVIVLDRREQEALAADAIRQDELDRWHEDLEALDRNGGFFASFNLVLVAGIV
ncbi:MAG TPA: methyltransferase domain-containing protein [Anaerolineales bacterium]|nr:methyltransferase domain-containing protein [Anaerolineales bacterium]